MLELESPRDFEHDEMRISTALLVRPIAGFEVTEASHVAVKQSVLNEIDTIALPYLALMLKHRHRIEVAPESLR